MIIHQPVIQTKGNEITVSARVETNANISLPKHLWYKFPLEYQAAVSDRTEGFISSLFLLGMHLNENIEIRGDVSPKLAHNIRDLKNRYYQRDPKKLDPVDLNFRSIKAADPDPNRNIRLSSFSGGVDSFYSFWSHFHRNESEHPTHLTHGLFILGFDLILQNQESYQRLFSSYQNLFDQWGLSLIQCSTNAYSFYQFRMPWIFSNVPTLVGAVMALGNQVSRFYQPGNFDPDPVPTRPSSFIHLFSTETTEFSSHAHEFNRATKLIKIFDWPPIQNNLRTCMNMYTQDEKYGCQRCSKCLNTNLLLYLYNKQDRFPAYTIDYTIFKFIEYCWTSTGLFSLRNSVYYEKILKNKRYDFLILFWLMVPVNAVKALISNKIIPRIPRSFVYSIKKRVYKRNISPQED